MKKITAGMIILIITAIFCSCSGGRGVWGKYYTEKDESGNYKTVEFAYSKTFYVSDALACEAEKDEDENDALFEGWYTQDGDTLTCTYSHVTENEEGKKSTEKFTLTFTYDKENDTLTAQDGTVYGKGEQK